MLAAGFLFERNAPPERKEKEMKSFFAPPALSN